MKRSEVKRAAKNLVAWKGPDNVMEFADEMVTEDPDVPRECRQVVADEAVVQAQRVLDFLFK